MATIETILNYIKPYTEQKGIFLEKKIELCDRNVCDGVRMITICLDIASSFEKNESLRIKNFLRKQGFTNCGVSCFEKTFHTNV
jgi:hypothetical protein